MVTEDLRAGLEAAACLQRLLSDWTGSSPTVAISGLGGRDKAPHSEAEDAGISRQDPA